MGPTWALSAPDGPMLAPWTLLSGTHLSALWYFPSWKVRLQPRHVPERTEGWRKHIPHDDKCCMDSQVLTQSWCQNWLNVVNCRELFCMDTERAGCSDIYIIPEATKWIRDAKTYRWLNANETSLPLWELCLFRIKPSIYVTLIN